MEEKQNIAFVHIIEKYPCLYDYTLPEYCKRSVCEKAWKSVAKDINISVLECKEKWKNLRTALARAQKKLPSGAKKKKYYLQDAMAFVLPFIKSRVQFPNTPSPSSEHEDELTEETFDTTNSTDSTVKELDAQSDEPESQCSITELSTERQCSVAESPNLYIRHKQLNPNKRIRPAAPTSSVSEEDKSFIEYVKRKSNIAESNADLEFLQSLLPDVTKMDCKRKRRFKRSVLELIDNILAEQEDEDMWKTVDTSSSLQEHCQSNASLRDEIVVFVKSILSQLKILPKSICNPLLKEIENLIDSAISPSSVDDNSEETSLNCDKGVSEDLLKSEIDVCEYNINVVLD